MACSLRKVFGNQLACAKAMNILHVQTPISLHMLQLSTTVDYYVHTITVAPHSHRYCSPSLVILTGMSR